MTAGPSIPQRWSPLVGALATLTVLIGGLGASFAAYGAERRAAQHERDERMALVTNNASAQLQVLVSRHVETAWSAADFLGVHRDTTRRQFVAFSSSLRSHVDGILGVGYVRRVLADEMAVFEAAAQADGAPTFDAESPVGVEAAIILYNEPASDLRASWGADLRRVPAASAALDAATDSGRPALTSRVTLAVDRSLAEEQRPAGYVIYIPVFDPGLPAATPAERRAAVVGWANVPFRARDLLARLPGPDEVSFRLVDPEGQATPSAAPPAAESSQRVPIRVLDESWTLEATPSPAFLAGVRDYSVAAGLLGVGSTAVVATLVLMLATGSRRWERAAQRATAWFAESERRLRATVASAPDLILVTDSEGRIVEASDRSNDLLHRRPETLVGSRLRDVIPGLHVGRTGSELAVRRRDGTIVPVEVRQEAIGQVGSDPADGRHVVVVRDVTDRVLAADAAERARDALAAHARELERSNRDLEEFAEVAAHDLSEPVRVVGGFASLLRKQYDESGRIDGDAVRHLDAISAAAERMLACVGGLLDVARVRSEAGPLVPVDLGCVFDDAMANLEVVLRESHARVDVGDLPVVCGDHTQLVRVAQNLIANAVRFAHPEQPPRISVKAEPDGRYWAIHVSDDGIGIAASQQVRIFAMFKRGHETRGEGSGIGLAVCRRILDLHGGDITVRSTEGRGSTFTFRLRRAEER